MFSPLRDFWAMSSITFYAICFMETIAAADCVCGYAVNDRGGENWLFTDSVETDFTRLKSIAATPDWRRQEFNVSAEAGRGIYSKLFTPKNVDVGPNIANKGRSGHHVGVELTVGATIINGAVPVAEMDSTRQDIFSGSFRAGMKLTAVKGTCAAFFWYFNDTQEIDMEFLSTEYDQKNGTFPVNLVIQSKDSAQRGYDASGTSLYKTVPLKFDPTAAFHEYRFDYLPGKVLFYADSELLAEMKGSQIPDSAGHLILQHWSNGNEKWSGGPPQEDATIIVSYVKAYFNSSDTQERVDWTGACNSKRVDACLVPNGTANDAAEGGQFLSPYHTHGDDDESLATATTVKFSLVSLVLIALVLIGAD